MNAQPPQTDSSEIAAAVRLIAFYLPQYHPIPENDRWWGEGFTEWTNVRKAVPNFAGHYQPHEPGELGYYDLRDPDVRERQAALAREHGIDAFCYYYYWFNGKRLLEGPLNDVLASGKPDFPFCVCWANENWTRRWDGREQDILVAQQYSREDSVAFIRSLFPLFRDRRYLRVNGRPLVLIYKAVLIPDVAATVALWRNECREAGFGEIYLVTALTTWHGNPEALGFDAAVDFPPHGHHAERVNEKVTVTHPQFAGAIFDFPSYVAQLMTTPHPPFKLFRGLLPSWDNTARQQHAGTAFIGSSPELFQYWLERALEQTRLRHRGDERLVFINAWNEWGEGCHLEPDRRYGRAYLEAVRDARAAPRVVAPRRAPWADVVARAAASDAAATTRVVVSPVAARAGVPPPRVSVIMPAYNHQRFVGEALDSIVSQTLADLEIIVVDDGSRDATGALVDEFAAQCATHAVTVVHQLNEGAHAAINRGMARARGEYIALANSDDRYAPTRLRTLVDALAQRGAGFAFSATRFIDDDGVDVGADNAYVGELRAEIAHAAGLRNPLGTLLRFNVAISTGNFVFRRTLLDQLGGINAMRVCHDWDFILAASYVTPLVFVDEPLYGYRLHRANTFSGLRLVGHLEGDEVRRQFFDGIAAHPVLADPALRQEFLREVRRHALTSFLPPAMRREAAVSGELHG